MLNAKGLPQLLSKVAVRAKGYTSGWFTKVHLVGRRITAACIEAAWGRQLRRGTRFEAALVGLIGFGTKVKGRRVS
jgi:hypothetical protein